MPNDENKLQDVNATLKDVELDLLRRKVDRQDGIISQLVSDETEEDDADDEKPTE